MMFPEKVNLFKKSEHYIAELSFKDACKIAEKMVQQMRIVTQEDWKVAYVEDIGKNIQFELTVDYSKEE